MNKLSNSVLFFYKGTSYPQLFDIQGYEDIHVLAKTMIKKGLENNLSIKEQIYIYVQQLDAIENEFNKCNTKNDVGVNLKIVAKTLNMEEKQMNSIWVLNIIALLIMKHLKNDEMNGTMFIY